MGDALLYIRLQMGYCSGCKKKNIYEFTTLQNLQIYVVFTKFVKILTSDDHKKIIMVLSSIFFNFRQQNLRETLYYIFKSFDQAKFVDGH